MAVSPLKNRLPFRHDSRLAFFRQASLPGSGVCFPFLLPADFDWILLRKSGVGSKSEPRYIMANLVAFQSLLQKKRYPLKKKTAMKFEGDEKSLN